MDFQCIRSEVIQTAKQFAHVEAHPSGDGGGHVKSVIRRTAGKTYFLPIFFSDCPSPMSKMLVSNPTLRPTSTVTA
jgi:hypothetical protein